MKLISNPPFPAGFTIPIPGASGDVPYVSEAGFLRDPLLVATSFTGPIAVGVMENVCGSEELWNVSTTGKERPPPDGLTVMAPVKDPFGVTVNAAEDEFSRPPIGPVTVNVVAAWAAVNGCDGLDDGPVPSALVAETEQV